MPPFTSDALVLRTYKLGETSKVVVLLSRERGKLRAVAKGARGARNRYRSALEPLSEVRATLYGRQGAELLRLGECELLRSAFLVGGAEPESRLAMSYYAELLDAFAQEGEAEDAVYRLALAVVRAAEEGTSGMALARYLEAWLLRLHGLYPPLDRCASCGGRLPDTALRYHPVSHGFACDDCAAEAPATLSRAARSLLERMFREPPAALGRESPGEARELEGFHHDLIAMHLERELRSYRVLREVARGVHG
jgi:DNA repair protein RecO (recombination protein O)